MPTVDTSTAQTTDTPIKQADPAVKSFGATPKKSSLAVNSIGEAKVSTPLKLNSEGTAVAQAPKPAPKKAVAKAAATVAETTTEETADDEPAPVKIPVKLQGKSTDDLIAMYTNLESVKGRMANEVGQLRAVIDELLSARAVDTTPKGKTKKAVDTDEPVTSDKLLSDPDNVISDKARKAVKKDLDDTSDRVSKLEYAKEKDSFERDFPAYAETMTDEDFLGFIQKSPYRTALAKAAYEGSFPAARELFGLYGEIQSVRAPKTKKVEEADTDAATTVRPGASGPATKPAKQAIAKSQKKTWTKKEIRKLFMTNRASYTRQFDEIKLAYREKRVVE